MVLRTVRSFRPCLVCGHGRIVPQPLASAMQTRRNPPMKPIRHETRLARGLALAPFALFALFALALFALGTLAAPPALVGQRADAGSVTVGVPPRTAIPPTAPPRWHAAIDEVRQQLHRDVAADEAGGITAAVWVGDRMIWAEGFGWADRDRRIPAGVGTIYRIGSISKPVTAIALAQLADRDGLDLDAPVETVLPEAARFRDPPDGGARGVTFRRIATHSAGLVREPELQGAASGPIEQWEGKVLESIPHTGFLDEPGERVSYSNIGFGTLGLAISRAAGRPFMELVEEEIFAPLGMRESTFVVGPELEPLLSVGYQVGSDGTLNTEPPAREHAGRGYKVPNGGVYSTVGDLGRLIGAMSGRAGETILSEAMRREVLRRQSPGDGPSGYGLGFAVRETDEGHTLVSHGGSVAGYTAYMAFEPGSGIGVVLLRNYNRGETNLGGTAIGLLTALLEGLEEGPAEVPEG